MDLNSLLKELEGIPIGKALKSYLEQRNKFPEIRAENPEGDARGSFTVGQGYPEAGTIKLSPRAEISTLLHELTHAADRQTVNQYYEGVRGGKYRGDNPQFGDAYEKLRFGDNERYYSKFPGGTQWHKENYDYRASPTESKAWAVGNMYDKWPDLRYQPRHLDSSLATDMEILLDLASRKRK